MVSLYINIPNLEAIIAILEFLREHRPDCWNPKNDSLIELLKLVLELNNFQFNNENFIQVGGTAMGTRVAPSLANIFMARFEEEHLPAYRLEPLVFKRYIDDLLFYLNMAKTS